MDADRHLLEPEKEMEQLEPNDITQPIDKINHKFKVRKDEKDEKVYVQNVLIKIEFLYLM